LHLFNVTGAASFLFRSRGEKPQGCGLRVSRASTRTNAIQHNCSQADPLLVTLVILLTFVRGELACISAWAARCDDSLDAAVLLEVNLVRVFPKRGKRVGLARFCVNASLSRRCISIDLWSRAYRQDMLPGRQHRIVTPIKPQIRNVDTVDKQDEVLESPKVG